MSSSKRIAALLPLLLCGAAHAAEPDTSVLVGMAGAGGANPHDGASIRRSPAAMLLDVGYTSQVDVAYDGGWRLNSSVKDTRTSAFGAGVAYGRGWSDAAPTGEDLPGWGLPEEQLSDKVVENSWRLGMGYGFLQASVPGREGPVEIRRLAVGGGVVYERELSELSGLSDGFGFDASVAGRPLAKLPGLVLSGTVHDLGRRGPRDPSVELGAYLELTRGLVLAADGSWDSARSKDPYAFDVGASFTSADVLTFRAGYALDRGRSSVAGGIGVGSAASRLDYGIRVGLDDQAMLHSLGISAAF